MKSIAVAVFAALSASAQAEQIACQQETVIYNATTTTPRPVFIYGPSILAELTKTAAGVTLTALGYTYPMKSVEQFGNHLFFYATDDFKLWLSDADYFDQRSIYVHAGNPRGYGGVFDRLPNTYRFRCTLP